MRDALSTFRRIADKLDPPDPWELPDGFSWKYSDSRTSVRNWTICDSVDVFLFANMDLGDQDRQVHFRPGVTPDPELAEVLVSMLLRRIAAEPNGPVSP